MSEDITTHNPPADETTMTPVGEVVEGRKKAGFTDMDIFGGKNPYGDKFDGVYTRVAEMRDLLPEFKELYYERRKENPNYSAMKLIAEFNDLIHPKRFYPYKNQYRVWRRRWDADILAMLRGAKLATDSEVNKLIQTRDADGVILPPSDELLEMGSRTMAGELMNDAMGMLHYDQNLGEDFFEDEILVKRRKYVLDVFKHVSDSVTKKEAIKLKKAQGQRETASFMMDLLRQSTAGKITPEQMDTLKSVVAPAPNPAPHE